MGTVPAGLEPGELHVWAVPLEAAPERLAALAARLSPEELARAARFKFEVHRNRYIAGRGALREILGIHLATPPAALGFTYTTQGKPALAGDPALHFNLAHSDGLALAAVTRAGPVGVDVERIRPVKDAADLVARFFSPRENEMFQQLPPAERPAAFFNLWTRKEALLKATGEGIAGGLNRVEVSFLPGEPARLLALAGDGAAVAEWSLAALSPAPGFVGAVAVRSREVSLRCFRISDIPATS